MFSLCALQLRQVLDLKKKRGSLSDHGDVSHTNDNEQWQRKPVVVYGLRVFIFDHVVAVPKFYSSLFKFKVTASYSYGLDY